MDFDLEVEISATYAYIRKGEKEGMVLLDDGEEPRATAEDLTWLNQFNDLLRVCPFMK